MYVLLFFLQNAPVEGSQRSSIQLSHPTFFSALKIHHPLLTQHDRLEVATCHVSPSVGDYLTAKCPPPKPSLVGTGVEGGGEKLEHASQHIPWTFIGQPPLLTPLVALSDEGHGLSEGVVMCPNVPNVSE